MGLMRKYTVFYAKVKWLTSSSTSASLLIISSERPWNVGTLWKRWSADLRFWAKPTKLFPSGAKISYLTSRQKT